MRTPMFVFVGLDETATELSIEKHLQSLLLTLRKTVALPFELMKSKAGLAGRQDDVAYYVSIIHKKNTWENGSSWRKISNCQARKHQSQKMTCKSVTIQ